MNFRYLLILITLMALPLMAVETQPNFIVILIDDMGWGDVGYQGADDLLTPNIDQLANEGVQFSQGYTPCSVCGPSRASLISGRYSDKFGIWGNFGGNSKQGFPVDQKMMSDYMKQAGYTTGAIGKWHFGHVKEKFKPWNRNWDFFYGFMDGGHDYYKATKNVNAPTPVRPIYRNREPVDYNEGDYLTEKFSEEAVDFIDRNSEKPFFLYLAYNAVHHPWTAPESYYKRVDEAKGKSPYKFRRILGGMVLAVDDGIGAIRAKLKEKGIDDNTVIVFLADNGSPKGVDGKHRYNLGETRMSSKAGLKGFKGDTYEGGVRIPFLIKWTDKIKAGSKYDYPVISMDVLATMTAAIGVSTKGEDLDGVNLLPYIQGEDKRRPHEVLYYTYQDDFAIRVGDWKLTWNDQELEENHLQITEHRQKVGPPASIQTRLFNLAEDPYEKNNLKASNPEKAKELQKMYDKWSAPLPLNGKPLFSKPFTRK